MPCHDKSHPHSACFMIRSSTPVKIDNLTEADLFLYKKTDPSDIAIQYQEFIIDTQVHIHLCFYYKSFKYHLSV